MSKTTTIKARILWLIGLLAGGYLLVLGMVQLSSSATHRLMSQASSSLFPAALRMQEAEAAFERMKKHYGDAIVLEDPKSLDAAEKDASAAAEDLDKVRVLLEPLPNLNQKARNMFEQFSSIRTRDRQTYTAILASKDGPTDEMMAQVGARGKENTVLSEAMDAFDKDIGREFQASLDTVDSYSVRTRIAGIVFVVLALAACSAAWWIVQYKVVLPLHILCVRMRDIAEGEGDLTRRIAVEGHNEIDEVGVWFNVFIARVEDIVRKVAGHAQTLRSAASDLTQTALESSSMANEQLKKSNHISVTMNEFSNAVAEISETSNQAVADARAAEDSAHSGGQTVSATVRMIEELMETNGAASKRIEELGRSSHAIEKIVQVINEIAGQTNLLALNASIEAARAGEHGRGFTVVAGEVRRLAERTTAATKEIDETVRAFTAGHFGRRQIDALKHEQGPGRSGIGPFCR